MSEEDNKKWYEKICVEPSVTLYMFAFMITTVFEQAFFIHKACRVNHGFSQEICENLHNETNVKYNYDVQVTVSNFIQWDCLATGIIPVILVLFLGTWSDKHGRKLPLIIGLCGKLLYSVMIIINSLQPTWPLEYVIWTASLPMALTGADSAIFTSAYSYLSDVTTVSTRTFRITIFDACYLSSMPLGIALGRYLFVSILNKSYTLLFVVNVALLCIAIFYSLLNLKWQTNSKQIPLRESEKSFLTEFFDKDHFTKTLKCLNSRPGRMTIIPFIFIMIFYRFQREEKLYQYLFFFNKMNWDYNQFSYFKIAQTALMVFMMIIGIPLMVRVFQYPDPIIIMIGTMSFIISRFIFMTVSVDWLFYLAATIGSLGFIIGPTFRSMVSKSISSTERGRVFSLLSVAEYSVPLYSSVLFSQLYNSTVDFFPAAFFLLTIISQVLIGLIVLIIYITVPSDQLIYKEPEEKENIGQILPENQQFITKDQSCSISINKEVQINK